MNEYEKKKAEEFPLLGYLLRLVRPADELRISRLDHVWLQSSPQGTVESGVFLGDDGQEHPIEVPDEEIPADIAGEYPIKAGYSYVTRPDGTVKLHYYQPLKG